MSFYFLISILVIYGVLSVANSISQYAFSPEFSGCLLIRIYVKQTLAEGLAAHY